MGTTTTAEARAADTARVPAGPRIRHGTSTAKHRFFSKVTIPSTPDGCWIWRGADSGDGYGKFWFNGQMTAAHRYAYRTFAGSISPGLQLDHLCRNTRCVRPDHLEPVTGKVNTLRGNTVPAANAAKTHCKNGHEFDEENTEYVAGARRCRICTRARWRADTARMRARRRAS